MSETTPILRMSGISKSFPGVKALQEVHFEVARGEIHALVGENGAGKSTLMKILTGAYRPDSGQIAWHGRPVTIASPSDSQTLGISMIHQELSLLPYLTVGQNIFLGREPQGRLPGFINWQALYAQAQELLERLSLDVKPRAEARELSIAQQQMVEVAKALSLQADLIAMDEPTSSLTDVETEVLFTMMRALKAQGVAIVFISHRLEEVFEITDRVTVLRDGRHIDTRPTSDLTRDKIVELMVGRELGNIYPYHPTEQRDLVLEVSDLCDGRELKKRLLPAAWRRNPGHRRPDWRRAHSPGRNPVRHSPGHRRPHQTGRPAQ